MKILYTNFHPRNGGGHVTYILNLLQGLKQQHSITVATPVTSRLYRYVGDVAGVHRIALSFPVRLTAISAPIKLLRNLIKAEKFDVVHVNGSSDHKLVMLATRGLVHRPRIVFTKHNDHPIRSIGNWLRAMLATDATIGVSDYIKEKLSRSPYRYKSVVTVRHGIDTELFAPIALEQKQQARATYFPDVPAGRILLGSAAGTDDDKGWMDLACALAQLDSSLRDRFHVILIGDKPKDTRLAQLANLGVQDHFSFLGLLDDVRPWLSVCDMGFVLSYHEALSFACRELMALGLPVLVTRVGGLPENLVDGREGWVVPAKDASAIAQVLRQVAVDVGQLQSKGKIARQTAELEFNMSKFVANTLEVYQARS
jgi:glycosyltransferase involved in cell wall biosynthesis